MKLTKGMKKALSLLLAGALAISGANTGVIANAEEAATKVDTIKYNFTVSNLDLADATDSAEFGIKFTDSKWNNVAATATVAENGEYSVTHESLNMDGFPNLGWFDCEGLKGVDSADVELTSVVFNGEYEFAMAVTGTAVAGGKNIDLPNIWNGMKVNDVILESAEAKIVATGSKSVESMKLFVKAVATETPEEPATTPTDGAVSAAPATEAPATEAPTKAPTEAPTATPTLIPESARTTAEKFDIKFQLTHADWSSLISDPVSVTGNGDYTITATVPEDVEAEDIMMLWLDCPELGYDNDKNIVITSGDVKVNDTVYKADANWWYRDCDSLEEAGSTGLVQKADGTGKDCSRRMNYRNQYNNWFNEKGEQVAEKSPVDAFAGTEIPYKAGDKISINITVSGMAEKSGATTAPTNGAINATAASIASPATAKITAAKKVVVAAGKTKNVKFTAEIDAPATSAAVVTATVKGNKKVTAKVVDGKVQIKAAKKAVKGSTAKVTLTSTNASGASVKATINVSVQNKAKKIKAPKKVTIKKGKTAKVVIKVKKAENKKKAITDTPKVTIKKVAKYMKAKTQIKKGKVVITLKGKKKGSAKMTVKIGKAKAKVNVKVK